MSSLMNKKVILGVTGGIAAYKAAELVRRLIQAGAEVRVVMTAGAQAFVTPLTFQALSGHPVHTELLDPEAELGMGHIQLARWADVVVIAPASANTLARLAAGEAADLLTTLCLATEAPLCVAPAMNQQMWLDAATQANIQTLAQRQVTIFGPAQGEQACGEVGPGRMLEADELVVAVAGLFETGALAGRRVLITAGPTREAIDPVRYISNHSSGKMGYALAQAAVEAGARVTLVSGPTRLTPPEMAERIDVESAGQMLDAVLLRASGADIFIATAAVADYRVEQIASSKIKKDSERLSLELVKNPDILATVSSMTESRPFCVGFAAETDELIAHAQQKLQNKGLDMIAANRVGEGLGFNSDDNALQVLWADGGHELPMMSKDKLARELIKLIAEHYSR
ncbi:MAG: bifunctional phosphopantothenoylcysteine decarboxylase/phosphopantothenate--cysteine ligase CoaBC [Gammaproteobacteria bacterium]|nr:bifunctional phosphopantothenoylcysteine decarboxylase/phosphopantothenate--cysteine ligase CoaBC [Gammaproteobacteria bacterium]